MVNGWDRLAPGHVGCQPVTFYEGACHVLEYDLAIDEYLHAIVRTRPWTVRRDSTLLEPLSDWLYAQADLSVELDAVTPAVIYRYATDQALPDSERDALIAAVGRLKSWTETRGLRDLRRAVEVATG